MNTKFLKIVLVVIFTFIFCLHNIYILFANNYSISNVKKINEYDIDSTIDDIDSIKFGRYPQSDISWSNQDSIDWIVLYKDEVNRIALLFSKYILDCKCYSNKNVNDDDLGYIWENSTLRKWLNGDFYNNAFNNDEKQHILTSKLKNCNYINHELINETNVDKWTNKFKENGSMIFSTLLNDTYDKVFCLSIDEARVFFNLGNELDYLRGYNIGKYFATHGTNFAKSIDSDGHTPHHYGDEDYFDNRKLLVYSEHMLSQDSSIGLGNSHFWLRDTQQLERDDDIYMAAIGSCSGEIYNDLYSVDFNQIGVRPAIWVSY